MVHILEHSDDGFHIVQIHGIIRMIHIGPSSDAIYENPPFIRSLADV